MSTRALVPVEKDNTKGLYNSSNNSSSDRPAAKKG
jgi:hypothetical protein